MERRTRVYPARKPFSRWISIFLLASSALLAASGLLSSNPPAGGLSILKIPQSTSIPIDTPFDDTPASKEITLPSHEWYALQLGAFEEGESARRLAEQFTLRGAGGYVWHDTRYRVLATVYPLKDDAQQVRQQLETQHGIDSYLFAVQLPSLKLRLRGMQGQLDILEAALIHAGDLVSQLQRLCVRMDRQEASAEEAMGEVNQLSTLLQTVSLRLKQRFTVPRPSCVDELIVCFDEFASFANEQNNNLSLVTLGSSLKYQTLKVLDTLKHIYDTLGNT